jgi:hypothetical protein
METPEVTGMGLADAIRQIRTELEQVIKEGKSSDVGFQAGPLELEFEVAFTRGNGINGGLQLSVLAIGAKKEQSSIVTHRIRINLSPLIRDESEKTGSGGGGMKSFWG